MPFRRTVLGALAPRSVSDGCCFLGLLRLYIFDHRLHVITMLCRADLDCSLQQEDVFLWRLASGTAGLALKTQPAKGQGQQSWVPAAPQSGTPHGLEMK